ncbi:MAG: hypothetical protein ABI723_09525, partial [Bacteroidia bacterium]
KLRVDMNFRFIIPEFFVYGDVVLHFFLFAHKLNQILTIVLLFKNCSLTSTGFTGGYSQATSSWFHSRTRRSLKGFPVSNRGCSPRINVDEHYTTDIPPVSPVAIHRQPLRGFTVGRGEA